MKISAFIQFVAVFGVSAAFIEPFGSNVCRLFGDNVKLRSPGQSCKKWIQCQNGVISNTGSCKTGQNFIRNEQNCAGKTAKDTYCKDPCKKSSPLWVADPQTCEGYYKCVKGSGKKGSCGSGLHFNQAQQACIWQEESSCIGYNICDIAPDGVAFRNESDCQQYLVCTNGKVSSFFCEDGYFDPNRGCVDRAEVQCLDHPIPYLICGTKKRPIWNKFVRDRLTCRGYRYCRDMGEHEPDLAPSWGQCPEGKFFSFELQACYTPYATACDRDRCEGRNRAKVISATRGCRHYWTCVDNVRVAEEQCPPGLYFDDVIGECTDQVKTYNACS